MEWVRFGRVVRHEAFWALQGISFGVQRGECLGVIGVNGAGKKTPLKILSRALYPTSGGTVVGRLVSLLELGTGFHPELTGRQNILQRIRLLGFPEEDVRRRIRPILDFAEIGELIDQPACFRALAQDNGSFASVRGAESAARGVHGVASGGQLEGYRRPQGDL
jgi:ABC-type polysaccharide/polyol phosphate transport system ATPase subunit